MAQPGIHDRDFEMEDDIRTVKNFAKLKGKPKRFAQVKKAIEEEIELTTAEIGSANTPSK